MKFSAQLREAITSLLGNFERKIQNENKKKNLFFVTILSAFFLSGFFYSLSESIGVVLKKTTDSVFAREAEFDYYEVAENFQSEICNQPLPAVSMSDPNLVIYKIQTLCQKTIFENEKEAVLMKNNELRMLLTTILTDTPMKTMIDPISEQENIVAAFLVGIALKESGLGEHAPHKNGMDCFNYWGFKGKKNPTAGGYSCFDSPKEAVETVGERLRHFAIDQNRNTPGKMLVWKCGSSCNGHSEKSVAKWVADVDIFFQKIRNL